MKEKIKVIRMVCGMLRKKNTGIILCKDSKGTLIFVGGKGGDIAANIETAMDINEDFRSALAAGVFAHIISEGSIPALNEAGLLELKKILEKTIAEGGEK